MDVAFLGLGVPKVGFLAVKDPNDLFQNKKKTKLPGIISWSLIKLVYQEFIKEYPVEVFHSFQCLQNVDSLLFSQLCVYYYTIIRPAVVNKVIEADCVYTESITANLDGEVVCKKNTKKFTAFLMGLSVGTVQISMDKEPTCIPGNAMLTMPGNTSKIKKGQLYILEQAALCNLPCGLVLNSCCVTPKARKVPVILINTTGQNIWVRQPLLTTELLELEVEPQQYHTEFYHEGDEITISFLLAAPQHMKDKNKWRIIQWRWKKI